MDCRAFEKKHLEFVDDTLPGVMQRDMRAHLALCERCSALDHRVRRSLIVARNNIPSIELSAQFEGRFAQRLEQERRMLEHPRPYSLRRAGWWALAACGLCAVGYGAFTARISQSPVFAERTITAVSPPLFPTRAVGPEHTTGLVSSVSTGFPVIPALLLAEEPLTPPAQSLNVGLQRVVARQ